MDYITACICTYKRAKLLRRGLHLDHRSGDKSLTPQQHVVFIGQIQLRRLAPFVGLLNYTQKPRERRRWYRCLFGAHVAGGHAKFDPNVGFNVPVRADGLGRLAIGANTGFGFRGTMMLGDGKILLQARTRESSVRVGPNCHFNNKAILASQEVILGSDCLIGDGVMVYGADFHHISPDQRHVSNGKCAPVAIGNNVWFGSRAEVLEGVSRGTLVEETTPSLLPCPHSQEISSPMLIAAGIPARKV